MGLSKHIESMLDFPDGALSGEMVLEICGTHRVILNGDCDILQYSEDSVCVRSKGQLVRFCGERLTIESLTVGDMVLTGAFVSVEFL